MCPIPTDPAISVILPIYRVERELPACLESLAAQSLGDYELILVDDGSPDGCGVLCDAWAAAHPNARVLHQQNQGLSGARNAGIAAARGRYLCFVDSDDLLLPDFLEQLYQACETTGADLALCGIETVDGDGRPLCPAALQRPAPGLFDGRALLEAFYQPASLCYTVAWNKLYRAALWAELRYPQGRIHEDDAVAHHLFLACRTIACVEQPLYRYRQRPGSISQQALSPARFDGIDALLDRCACFAQAALPAALQAKAAQHCWRQYLYLCGQAALAPTPALCARMAQLQPALRRLPCTGLSARERLSAWRWSRFDPHTLLGLPR